MTELPLRKLITIENTGADLASTNYWQTEHARTGKCYLSGNAGTWRLLVPKAAEHMLSEMQTGSRVNIEPSMQADECWDVIFEDGSSSPFFLAIDRLQVDRAMTAGACRIAVWTESGKQLDLPCFVNV